MWGLNIRKGGEDPAVGKDEDYPEVCAAMRGSCSDRRACALSPAIYLTSVLPFGVSGSLSWRKSCPRLRSLSVCLQRRGRLSRRSG